MVPPTATATAPNPRVGSPDGPAIKDPAKDTILTPRFYTTDFDAMAAMDLRPNEAELEAICEEFRKDYNRHHFVRNDEFEGAAEKLDPTSRKVFIEFLEQSCTSEFSGFLLYKDGAPVAFDPKEVSANLRDHRNTTINLTLKHGSSSVRFWTCDLTKEYVELNADYTT